MVTVCCGVGDGDGGGSDSSPGLLESEAVGVEVPSGSTWRCELFQLMTTSATPASAPTTVAMASTLPVALMTASAQSCCFKHTGTAPKGRTVKRWAGPATR